MGPIMLDRYLDKAVQTYVCSADVAATIKALATAARKIAGMSAQTGLPDADYGALVGDQNQDGDDQKALDVLADEAVYTALLEAPVAVYLSEEKDQPVQMPETKNTDAGLMVAADPLDGSSNISTNLSVGTIFSILPAPKGDAISDCLMSGRAQLAAGYFIYGPQTCLLLTLGAGLHVFILDGDGQFQQSDWVPEIPASAPEFALNMANRRFWSAGIITYVDALLAGKDGDFGQHYNMRWCGSLVADAFRIFRRGGIFLYPADARQGYEDGRLRLVYEAHPIAFMVEQAGGVASDGNSAILDKVAAHLHARTPFIFGSKDEVGRYLALTQ